jgi:hypothetical protein
MACNLRVRKSFAARCAVNVGTIRRMADRLAPGMGVNGCVIGCGNGRGFDSQTGIELAPECRRGLAAFPGTNQSEKPA